MSGGYFESVRRVVVKVGSAVLCDEGQRLDRRIVQSLVKQLSELKRRGIEVVLVSSGAVATGMEILGMEKAPATLTQKQAVAALGQGQLIATYAELFRKAGIVSAQILLTHADLADRERYLNAKHAIQALLDLHIIPIVNENDTVSVEEIKFGDNDRLGALCAALVEADLLIVLSDIDALYTADPKRDPTATRVARVETITDELMAAAGGRGSGIGTGGMATKIAAIRDLTQRGIPALIAGGKQPGIISQLFAGKELGTYFPPSVDPLAARKHWIAYTLKHRGRVHVDEGAYLALRDGGKSLLAVGVVRVEGDFRVGDAVSIIAPSGQEVARGLVSYSSVELREVCGRRTHEIDGVLGYCPAPSVIHRDDLVLLGSI
ncbi:MAG: glutamate 5-kinase [Myxococcales bacterium]|nr:glutamate 5-kinase [Myxococcales bacterium]